MNISGNMKLDDIVNNIISYPDTELDDMYLNITQLIKKDGFAVEEHIVTTEDGYILKMFRIPKSGPPIFLMHGIISSSDDWISIGINKALAYSLAAQNYDVWMGNARGTGHSLKHVTLSSYEPSFWNYTWHEIGIYDVPTMIDRVLEITKRPSLTYIGHSQGTTVFYVMCSLKPEYNEKISLMVSLAPIAYITNSKFFLYKLLAINPDVAYAAFTSAGIHSFFAHDEIFLPVETALCGNPLTAYFICKSLAALAGGFNNKQVSVLRLPVIFRHFPTGSSVKQIIHYVQSGRSARFQQFDYGPHNLDHYNSPIPPTYPLENITAPIAIFFGNGDYLSVREDVDKFVERLPNVVDFYTVPDEKFEHFDFLWSNGINTLILPNLLKLIKMYTS
ncbi:unnamed protein product [Leptidea sinapis]|uniref:Lipase n=1 Tax=Leptidea sinapis TaxID=189913 RepID=A0A5E4PVT9_9NEOP|nr:unnamed protein product [Leptidea sinapis]